jgi:hypothetical protein
VRGTSALLENPDTGSVYVLRVRGCNKAGYGEYSEDVHLHTPPAPGEYTDKRLHVVDRDVHAEGMGWPRYSAQSQWAPEEQCNTI